MTDESPPRPGTPEANDLVQRNESGDPKLSPEATRMIERESYERLIEGLRMSADAAQHMAARESESKGAWRALSHKLDQCRRIAVQEAGLGLVLREQETKAKDGGNVMPFKDARMRFREGLQQAAGGARQLAVCFRMDVKWSRIAMQIEQMEDSLNKSTLIGNQVRRQGLILPEGYRQ
jgi:hypothetical protein